MDSEEMVSLAELLVEDAKGDSVTVKSLTNSENSLLGGGISSNEPVISYLIESEQPHYVRRLSTGTIVQVSGPEETHEVKPQKGLTVAGWFVVTNMRVIIIVNREHQDEVISIPLSAIQNDLQSHQYGITEKNKRFLLRTTKLVIKTSEYTYELTKPNKLSDEAIEYIRSEDGENQEDVEELHVFADTTTTFVCKKCEQEVPPSAKKCPHCGYYPGKGGKGALWHGTALATSVTPIGWAMIAKGAADEVRTRRGIAKEKSIKVESNEEAESNTNDPFEKLERLKKLKDEDVITEEEFQRKKDEILEDI